MNEGGRTPTLTEKTLIPIGIVVGIMAVVIGATWWLASTYSEIREVGKRLDRIEFTLNAERDNGMSKQDFDVWIKLFRNTNSTLNVPERIR